MKRVLLIAVALLLVSAIGWFTMRSKHEDTGAGFSVLKGERDGRPLFATIDMRLRNFRDTETVPFFLQRVSTTAQSHCRRSANRT